MKCFNKFYFKGSKAWRHFLENLFYYIETLKAESCFNLEC